jgi:hypothetical protein
MRKAIRASVLVMVLAVPAFAGEIPYDVVSPPPPNATQQGDIQNGVAGEIPNDVAGDIPYNVTGSVLVTLLVALIS